MTENITQLFSEISQLLNEVAQLQQQPNSTAKLESHTKSLKNQLNQLAPMLKESSPKTPNYEFFDESSDIVEQISQLRLTPHPFRKLLKETGLLNLLNQLVLSIKMTVYKFPALANQNESFENLPPNNIEAASTKAEAAARKASEVALAAEKAADKGMKYLEEVQIEKQRTGGLIDPTLLNESIQYTMTMYAMNTAAVIAADDATAAIAELEELVEASEQEPRKG